MLKVVKFGGSSLANTEQFKKVKKIIEQDDSRQIVVVSAMGKLEKNDHKITDLLYLTSAHLKYGVDATNVYEIIKNKYLTVRNDLNLKIDLEKEFDDLEKQFNKNIDEEMLVSRGEYFSGKLMAEYLGYYFADSKDYILFNYDGTLNEAKTKDSINHLIKVHKKVVFPGFYGSYPDGTIHLLSRGGSDVTGSIIASSINADIYENWTDVSGFLVTDPKIIKNPKQIKEISYEELRELSYMGANVLHEETIFPILESEIPINIRNTNRPDDQGTIITSHPKDELQIITGIAGKKDYESITIVKKPKAVKIEVMMKVLEVCNKYHVNVEHMPSSIDTFSLIVESKSIQKRIYEVMAEIKAIDEVQDVIIDNDIALIAVVGRNMATKPGISAKIFAIFGQNNINIKVIAQASQELSIIVGVENQDFEKAINAIYHCLVI